MTTKLLNSFERDNTAKPTRRQRKQTPQSQTESFKEITTGGTRVSQKQKVLDFLFFQKNPLSRREIARETGHEVTALCRVLEDCLSDPATPVVVAEQSPCSITRKRVYKYLHTRHFPEWKAKSESK